LLPVLLLSNCLLWADYGRAAVDSNVAARAEQAVTRGLSWLAARQKSNGFWSDEDSPALTGLPLWAFARSSHPQRAHIIDKARDALLSCVQEDGGIYRPSLFTGGLSTYNTAICMTALHALDDASLVRVIQNARRFMASSQYLGSERYDGGFGYARRTFIMHADLQNTAAAVQAMRLTADVEDLRPADEKRVDMDWDRALQFISRLQNPSDTGREHAGGFAYKPGASPAGSAVGKKGTVVLRATGSMTYSGLLSLVYARVGAEDPRVQSALEWARHNWSLEENPGLGASGKFFFYNVMSRALATIGTDAFRSGDGATIDWKRELIDVLLSAQRTGDEPGTGYWVNEQSGRFWESNPVLVTAYCILALQSATDAY
jgi:squalene-hopene/tetraprenyl-beta-curcumene cyclase